MLFELVLAGFFDLAFPFSDLSLLVLAKAPHETSIELLDVFVLFAFQDCLVEAAQLHHWVANTVHQATRPVERTSDWRHVLGDWRLLV